MQLMDGMLAVVSCCTDQDAQHFVLQIELTAWHTLTARCTQQFAPVLFTLVLLTAICGLTDMCCAADGRHAGGRVLLH